MPTFLKKPMLFKGGPTSSSERFPTFLNPLRRQCERSRTPHPAHGGEGRKVGPALDRDPFPGDSLELDLAVPTTLPVALESIRALDFAQRAPWSLPIARQRPAP